MASWIFKLIIIITASSIIIYKLPNNLRIKMASKQGYGADLRKFMDLRVDLRMNGTRRIAGIMKGYD